MAKLTGYVLNIALLLAAFGGLDLLILFLIRRDTGWLKIITAGMIYSAVIFFALAFAEWKLTGVNPAAFVASENEARLQQMVEDMRSKGAADDVIQSTRYFYNLLLVRTLPAWIFLNGLFIVFLNYYVVRLYAFRKFGRLNRALPFELWYLDERAIWPLLAVLALFAAWKFIPAAWMRDATLNLVLVMANVYFAAGLSVMLFQFKKHKVPPLAQFAVFMCIMLFSGPLFGIIWISMVLTGILDTWFNFRKIIKGGEIWKSS